MDPVELTLSDGEEAHTLRALWMGRGWMPALHTDGTDAWPVIMGPLCERGPYPTPGRCLWAPAGHLAEAVVAELFGVTT